MIKKIGLLHHKLFYKWLQPGGHSDGNSNTTQEALREAQEEFGGGDLFLLSNDIFDVDIHQIPKDTNRGLGSHPHYDIRFIVIGNSAFPPVVSNESREARWVPFDEVTKYNSETSFKRMINKVGNVRVV